MKIKNLIIKIFLAIINFFTGYTFFDIMKDINNIYWLLFTAIAGSIFLVLSFIYCVYIILDILDLYE